MNNSVFAFLRALVLIAAIAPLTGKADLEPTRSADVMSSRSVLVFEGTVLSKNIRGKEKASDNAGAVTVTLVDASINVSRVIKGVVGAVNESKQFRVRYRTIEDPKYKGEKVPELIVGKSYVFYIESFVADSDGVQIPIIHTKNNVRPLP